ncbi:MAG: hypothetical protein IPM64_17320 [Phycisphaerales bacterium]|nr:hypothetical protein [Phycisphaerales bacterium]
MTPERRAELIALARKWRACSGALEWIDAHPDAGLADLRPNWAAWALICVPGLTAAERAAMIAAVARDPVEAEWALVSIPSYLTPDERAALKAAAKGDRQ